MDEVAGGWRSRSLAHLPVRPAPGLWAHNKKLDVTSCTIITMPAGEPMAKLHDRQPVILDKSAYDAWMNPETSPAEAKSLLTTGNLDGKLQFQRVSRAVNSVKNQGAECVQPANPLSNETAPGLLL